MGLPIAYGLIIGGIRILPYAVRYGKDIIRIGYKVIAKGKHLKNAKQIFGSKNVIGDITHLARFSTKAEKFSPIKSEKIISLSKKGAEFSKNAMSTADDAANQVSKFIARSSSELTGGIKVAAPIRSLFGQNIKFSSQTLKNIARAEQGPTALGKEIIKAPIKPVSTFAKTAKFEPAIKPVKETVRKIQEFKAAKVGTDIIKTKILPTERPWYMAIVPKFLRTQTLTRATKSVSTGQPLPETLYKTVEKLKYPRATKAALGVATVAPFAVPPFIPEKQPDQPSTKDLDFNALFGKNVTGVQEYEQLKIPGKVGIHDIQR